MECRVRFSAGFLILLAAAIFLLPLKYLLAWAAAVTVHELFHWLALRFCGCRISNITIGFSGIQMQTEALTPGRELVCALVGPIGSLVLVLFLRKWPLLAICGLLQCVFNLLPIYPMDGGRVLHAGLCLFLPETKVRRVMLYISWLISISIAVCVIYLSVKLSMGILPVLLVGFLLIKRKRPCKENPLWYNRPIRNE